MNLVERWFKGLTDKRLRRGRFTSEADLTEAVELWAEHWNHDPKPFVWTKTAEEIITKVSHGRATLHQLKSATQHEAGDRRLVVARFRLDRRNERDHHLTMLRKTRAFNGIRGLVSVVFVVIVLAATSGVRVAHATNFTGGTGNSGCSANAQDNSTMSWHRTSGLSTAMRTAVSNALNNHVNPTDITVAAEQATPDGNTDVVYREANYVGNYCGFTWHSAGSLIGYTYCRTTSGANGGTCQGFDIFFDQSWEVSTTTTLRGSIACHETGHSLGLTHPGTGIDQSTCMSGPNGFQGYSTHEVGHINGFY